jgi:hypothetical protein
MNDSSMPIFLEEQGMWTAMESRTRWNSSLSNRKWRMNSTGSYSEKRSAGSLSPDLICARQGEVSHTMGHLPPSLALSSAASSSAPFLAAASLKPRELNIMPQQEAERPSGYTTS